MSAHLKWLAILAAAAVAGVLLVALTSTDPRYTLQEWLFASRFRRYDSIIEQMGRKYGVDPLLVKAVIWQESRFHPQKVGPSGERGLMQITNAAAADWVSAKKIETFFPADLFDPKTNIDAGTWYLQQALKRWREKRDPLPFALAEYNAGRSRVNRWIADSEADNEVGAEQLKITFPGTQQYVETVIARYDFYKKRGRM